MCKLGDRYSNLLPTISSQASEASSFPRMMVPQDSEQPSGKAVVMRESKAEIQTIVESGGFLCEPFRADETEEGRAETLNEFREGGIRAVAARGSFNIGIDIADICLIVHTDKPRKMLDYGQGSGRAGPGGLASLAIIMRGGLDLGDERISANHAKVHETSSAVPDQGFPHTALACSVPQSRNSISLPCCAMSFAPCQTRPRSFVAQENFQRLPQCMHSQNVVIGSSAARV